MIDWIYVLRICMALVLFVIERNGNQKVEKFGMPNCAPDVKTSSEIWEKMVPQNMVLCHQIPDVILHYWGRVAQIFRKNRLINTSLFVKNL